MGHEVEKVNENTGPKCFCCGKQRPGKEMSGSADGSGPKRFVCYECNHTKKDV